MKALTLFIAIIFLVPFKGFSLELAFVPNGGFSSNGYFITDLGNYDTLNIGGPNIIYLATDMHINGGFDPSYTIETNGFDVYISPGVTNKLDINASGSSGIINQGTFIGRSSNGQLTGIYLFDNSTFTNHGIFDGSISARDNTTVSLGGIIQRTVQTTTIEGGDTLDYRISVVNDAWLQSTATILGRGAIFVSNGGEFINHELGVIDGFYKIRPWKTGALEEEGVFKNYGSIINASDINTNHYNIDCRGQFINHQSALMPDTFTLMVGFTPSYFINNGIINANCKISFGDSGEFENNGTLTLRPIDCNNILTNYFSDDPEGAIFKNNITGVINFNNETCSTVIDAEISFENYGYIYQEAEARIGRDNTTSIINHSTGEWYFYNALNEGLRPKAENIDNYGKMVFCGTNTVSGICPISYITGIHTFTNHPGAKIFTTLQDISICIGTSNNTFINNGSVYSNCYFASSENCPLNLTGINQIDSATNYNNIVESDGDIHSIQKVTGGYEVKYDSGNCIELKNGFEVDVLSNFEAVIDGCD